MQVFAERTMSDLLLIEFPSETKASEILCPPRFLDFAQVTRKVAFRCAKM